MKALDWLKFLRDIEYLPSSQDAGIPHHPPSNGELRRWITQRCVIYNDAVLELTTEIEWPIHSLVLWPNGKMRTTLWRDK